MSARTPSAWSLGGLTGSLLLHAGIGFALWRAPEAAPPPPRLAALTWIEAAPPKTAPPVVVPEPAVRPSVAPTRPRTNPPAVRPQGPNPQTSNSVSATSDTPLAGSTGDGPTVPAGPDQRRTLAPGLGFVMQLPEASDAEDTRGTTLRNDPRDQPDQHAVAEYRAELAGRRLSLELATDVARAQQGAGRLPGFFTSVSRSLSAAAETTDVKVSKDSEASQRLNAVGAVLDPTRARPSEAAINRVSQSAFVENATRMGNPALPTDQQQFNQAVAQGFTRAESIKESLSATQLRTVVALTTDARGVLAEASIEERSGDRIFDESALHLSRRVMRGLPDSDDKALGSSWWRSRWVFTWEPPKMKVRLLEATPLPPPLQ